LHTSRRPALLGVPLPAAPDEQRVLPRGRGQAVEGDGLMAGASKVSRDQERHAAGQPAGRTHHGQTNRRIARRAELLAASEGGEMETWVEEGTRPGWRPQAVVYGDNAEQEFGSARAERRRILGRAAESAR